MEPSSSAIRLPAGVRDFLPRAAARRRAIAERLLAAFEAWGYARIITPMFECADVLERGLGPEARAAAIRFVEPGTGEVVALRTDITPQVARIVATRMHDVDGPLRLCYEGAVNRLAGPLGNREILQAGIELIDAEAPDGDAEALAVAAAALATTDLPDVRLDVGHVAPAHFVLGATPTGGGSDLEARRRLYLALSRKDKVGVARAAAGLPSQVARIAAELPTLWGPAEQVLARARALPWPREVRTGVDVLEEVLDRARDLMDPALHAGITVDLGEVRGHEYYTGIRFAGYAAGAGDAVVLGGRYDELVGRYGRAAHATGFAVDIEAIAQAQSAAGMAPPPGAHAVLVMAPRQGRREAAKLAAALRTSGIRAAVDLGGSRSHDQVAAYGKGVGFDHVIELQAGGGARVLPTGGGPAHKVSAAAVRQALAGDVAPLLSVLGVDDLHGSGPGGDADQASRA